MVSYRTIAASAILVMVSVNEAEGGTFTVTNCQVVSATTSFTPTPDGYFFTASAGASASSNTAFWDANAKLYRINGGSYGSIASITPRFKWTITWAPSSPGELPPTQAHCKLRMMGYATVQGYMLGYPYQFTGSEIASCSLTSWAGNNLYGQSLVPSGGAINNPFYETTGSTYQLLPDGDVYTGAFTLIGGTWTAYAEQQFPASIIGTVHLGPAIGTGKAGLAEGFFKMKTKIYEIDGQAIP